MEGLVSLSTRQAFSGDDLMLRPLGHQGGETEKAAGTGPSRQREQHTKGLEME